MIWNHEEEIFKPICEKNYDLEHICLLKSSLGFGLLALKNVSFHKIYTVKIFNKTICKSNIF